MKSFGILCLTLSGWKGFLYDENENKGDNLARENLDDETKKHYISHLYAYIYRTRVRSLGMLVTNSLTHSLTDSLPFSKLD